MTGQIHGDVQALGAQARALAEFRGSATRATERAERIAAEALEQITSELRRRATQLAAAETALRSCQKADQGPCDEHARQVAYARARLEGAQAALRHANQARAAFEPARARFVRECAAIEGKARGRLGSLSGDLESYLRAAGSSRQSPSSSSAVSGRPASSAGARSGMPDGWEMVPLSAIDDSGSPVRGAESFGKGYSPDDLRWGYGALNDVVMPAMAHGKGSDYFQERDVAEGRVGSRSYSDTFSGFFSDSNAIKLEPRGDGTYGVGNGYHRIWLAKQMGLSTVPARVR